MNTDERRTQEEIARLKENWRRDPCWNIEDTEGFEAHRDELRAYRLAQEAVWRENLQRKQMRFARELGLGNNLKLANWLGHQQDRIAVLETEIVELKERLARKGL